MASSNAVHLAILDDYAGIAPKHFQHIPNLKITSLQETISKYDLENDKTGFERQVTRLKPYEIISTMRERTPFPDVLVNELPNLKLLLTTSVRNASIDLDCCTQRKIVVTGTKGLAPTESQQRSKLEELPTPPGHSSVIQHAWALLLSCCSRLPEDDHALKTSSSAWQSGLMVPIAGKTLGIVGLGKLGVGMAKVGRLAFGMEILAWSENLTQAKADEAADKSGLHMGDIKAVSKEDLFKRSDVVSLHYVLSPRSRNLVSARELSWMKSSAILVNTSRGPLISEPDLIAALKDAKIRGCCLDVFWEEPLPAASPWRSVKDWSKSEVVLSPHMGYANAGTMERWYQEQAENVEKWMKGEDLLNKMN